MLETGLKRFLCMQRPFRRTAADRDSDKRLYWKGLSYTPDEMNMNSRARIC